MLSIIRVYGWMLLEALGQTILMTLLSLCIAFVIGLLFGLMNVSKNKVLNVIGTLYVDIIRGLPLLVLTYIVYFAFPSLMQTIGFKGFRLLAIQAGTAALSLNCGAYMAEIFRAGIQSVDKGQTEAARSLGLSYAKTMRLVVLPQAIVTMIPSIINQFIISLKDTSILSAIAFPELTNAGKIIAGNSLNVLGAWSVVGLMYLIVITALSKLAKKIERRVTVGK